MAVTTLASAAGAGLQDLSNAAKTFFSKQLLKTVAYSLVHGMFGQKTTINQGNKTFEWRTWANIAVAAAPQTTYLLTEGTTPADSVVTTVSITTATPAQYGTFVEGSDIINVVLIDPVLTIVNKKMAQHAGESIDLIARAALVASTNLQYAGTATAVNEVHPSMVVNYDELIEIVKEMKDNKVDPCRNGRWCAICSHGDWGTLMKDRDFKDAVTFGRNADALFTGKMGTFLGIDFYESAVAYTEAGTLTTVHSMLIFGDEAYGILSWAGMALESIYTPPGGLTDPLKQRWRHAWKASFVCKILNQDFMIRFLHAVSV